MAEETQEKSEEDKTDQDEAKEKVQELEQLDEPPSDLNEWPDDKAKYETFGGAEGDHGYDEGPEAKLGPSGVRHHDDGESVSLGGEEVKNPDDFKGEPIPGGPTDPNATGGPEDD